MIHENAYTGTPWERNVAYCRANRVGSLIFVSGTVAVDETGAVFGAGDLYVQTNYAIRKIEAALHQLGAELRHVVRTRKPTVAMPKACPTLQVHSAPKDRDFWGARAGSRACDSW